MGLSDRLKALGLRLRLIRGAPRCTDALQKITPRVTSLDDLRAEARAQALAALPEDLAPSFDRVFEAAGLTCNAWTVDRLRDLLRTEPYKGLDRPNVRQAISQLLAGENLTPRDLARDAISRERALDAFDARVLAKIKERSAARQGRVAVIERQIAQLNEECGCLKAADQGDQQALGRWQGRVEAYKKDTAWVVEFLVD